MNQKELNLLKEYNKQLQAENTAKSKQIQALRKCLQDYEQEIKKLKQHQNDQSLDKQKISKTFCLGCVEKEDQIFKLAENICELQKQIDNLQVKQHVGVQINKQSLPQANLINALKDNKKTTEKQLVQNKNQRQMLYQRIQYLQKRIFTLQDSNRILKEEILAYLHKRSPSIPIKEKITKEPALYIKSDSLLLPDSRIQNLKNYQYDSKHFSVSGSNNNLIQNRNQNSMIQFRIQNTQNTQFLTPKSIKFQNKKHKFYDQRNLIQEHGQSLRRKILLLKKQNQRLKQQISFTD